MTNITWNPKLACSQHVPVPNFVERKSDASMIHDGFICSRCGKAVELYHPGGLGPPRVHFSESLNRTSIT